MHLLQIQLTFALRDKVVDVEMVQTQALQLLTTIVYFQPNKTESTQP